MKYNLVANEFVDIPSVQIMGCLEYDQLRFYFTYTDIDLGELASPTTFLDSLLHI